MNKYIGILGSIALVAAAISWNAPALAQQQTIITTFSGTATANGTWTRTIIDISEPNGPGGGTIQATYPVVMNFTIGMTANQLAIAARNACNSTLPAPVGNPNGYHAMLNPQNARQVRLSKQAGTFNYIDSRETTFPIPGVTIVTTVPSSAEDAPIATPAGLAALTAGIAALAWWARRRGVSA